jgi:hypothetical protein
MKRYFTLLLPVVVCLSGCSRNQVAREQPAQEEKAVKAIEALGGMVIRDERLPGRPIVEVDLGGTGVKDADLQHLKGFKSLQTLILYNNQLTDAGLKDLKEFKGLRDLRVGGNQITDAGLKDLKEFKGLVWLGLGDTLITDAGLKDLKGLKNLETLNLVNTEVTEAGLKDLKQALPKTEIYEP